jgi:23S rRNA pseudouridine2605 synthase
MTDDLKSESALPIADAAPKTKKPKVKAKTEATATAKPKKAKVKIQDPIGDVSDGEAESAAEVVAEPETAALPAEPVAEAEVPETAPKKTRKAPAKKTVAKTKTEEPEAVPETPAAEAGVTPEANAEASSADDSDDTKPEAGTEESSADSSDGNENEDDVPDWKPRPPAKLERLQKILARNGIASRRKAEEMIEQGRVQVNGKVVTEMGTKADAGRDHIRVDGKLLQGAERLRYFVLNKPKGFVTTVKDPEGRPTVMEFFAKMRERLYPVGRLDYMSEGLLLMTNDGELANKLTKAASGVEKTYLVKVAGQPSESELDILRGGVFIERGKPGTPKVRTSPARIRQVRQGDNPWYEVVLIEGRNRELRKMFEAVGHFVEKIRRVGYGPLVLDQEPGNLRELQPEEVDALQKTADGKRRTPKSKDVRRRNAMDAGALPTVLPRPSSHPRPVTPSPARPYDEESAAAGGPKDFRPKRSFGTTKPFRSTRPAGEGYRPPVGRTSSGPSKFGSAARSAWKKDDRPDRPRFAAGTGEDRPAASKPYGDRPAARTYGAKPAGSRPYSAKPAGERSYGAKPAGRTYGAKPTGERSYGARPAGKTYGAKPAWSKPGSSSDRPAYKRPAAPTHREAPSEDFEDRKPVRLKIDAVEYDAPSTRPTSSARPHFDRPRPSGAGFSKPHTGGRPSFDRPKPGGAGFDKPRFDRPRPSGTGFSKPRFERPATGGAGAESTGYARPPRSESGLARPFTTSSGKPRAGGARPSSKPFGHGGSRPAGKTGWKPKPSFGGHAKSGAGTHSSPRPGGFSKSGYKGSGYKGKPSGKRPGGK